MLYSEVISKSLSTSVVFNCFFFSIILETYKIKLLYIFSRRYSRWFGQKGDAAPQLCAYALQNYSNWEQKIEEWQGPILENP